MAVGALGAIETDITAKETARMLNNTDCLVIGCSIVGAHLP
ncbi:MAG: hypothetical protein V4559_06615 [Pseudomonadota bacterium]